MSFFDDIEDDIQNQYEEDFYKKVDDWSSDYGKRLKNGINAALDTLNPMPYEEPYIEIYNCFTSAEFHRRISRFFADTKTPGVSQTVIRESELESLMQIKLPTNHKENFAAEYENFIIYIHMDDSTYAHNNVHFNRYTYNNPTNNPTRGEMDYFDMERDGEKIPYSEWEERLKVKKVLVFGHAPRLQPEKQEPLVFLGYHNGNGRDVVKDEDGSFKLSLNNSIGFQTSPDHFSLLV